MPRPNSGLESSDEECAGLSSAMVMERDCHTIGTPWRDAIPRGVETRSRVSPVPRPPDRRSPTAVNLGVEEKEERVQSQTGSRSRRALPDVFVEEEIPIGDLTQDGVEARACEEETPDDQSGIEWEVLVPLRSSSGSRSPTTRGSGRSSRRARSPAAGVKKGPCGEVKAGIAGEQVVTLSIPTVRSCPSTPSTPKVSPKALVKAPVPVTPSFGSPSSLGESGDSRGPIQERTGSLDWGTSDDGSEGGGRISRHGSMASESYSALGLEGGHWSQSKSQVGRSEGTSGVSSGGPDEQSIEESREPSSEERKETRWWAPLYEGYVAWFDRTRFILEREGVVDHWWAAGDFDDEAYLRALRVRWDRIRAGLITPRGSEGLDDPVEADEPLSWVLPGSAGRSKLTRTCRAERVIVAQYRRSHGLDYPYVPEPLMREIEENRERCLKNDIQHYIVDKGGAIKGIQAEQRVSQLMRVWKIGRSVYMHKVVYCNERGLPREYSVTVHDAAGREVKKPDPRHYY
ncbi:hypothetical protein FKM82_008882 [Ascaphus truei]